MDNQPDKRKEIAEELARRLTEAGMPAEESQSYWYQVRFGGLKPAQVDVNRSGWRHTIPVIVIDVGERRDRRFPQLRAGGFSWDKIIAAARESVEAEKRRLIYSERDAERREQQRRAYDVNLARLQGAGLAEEGPRDFTITPSHEDGRYEFKFTRKLSLREVLSVAEAMNSAINPF
jgi:hypothetical protein